MSSQDGGDQEQNAAMCYFPSVPFCPRYQIGFDIIVTTSEAQADPSVDGASQRVIHVELFFPDGFLCNPVPFDGLLPPPTFGSGAPPFLPPPPHFFPPMFPNCPHLTPPFHQNVPMGFQGPAMQQEHLSRVLVCVGNNQPGPFMVIDGTPYDFVQLATSGIRRNMDTPVHTANEGLIYNPVPFGGIPHRPLLGSDAPQFFLPRPPFRPPLFPNFPRVAPQFDHDAPVGFGGPMVWQQQHDIPVFANGGNSQQGVFMVNEDTPQLIIPQLNVRGEVLRELQPIPNNPSQYMPSQQPRNQPGHPSASGISGQRGTSHASPRTASRRVATYYKSRL